MTSSETEEALRESTGRCRAVIGVLEQTPPELSADILDRGIVLTGGGALLRGLEELIEERTGINTMTAEDPMKVVAIGTGQFVEFMSGRKEFLRERILKKNLKCQVLREEDSITRGVYNRNTPFFCI